MSPNCFLEYPQMTFKWPLKVFRCKLSLSAAAPSVPLVAQTLPSRFALCTPSPTCRCAPPFPCTRKRKTQWVSAVFCFLFTCWSYIVMQKTDRPVASIILTLSLSLSLFLFFLLPRSHRCFAEQPSVKLCCQLCCKRVQGPRHHHLREWVSQPSPHLFLRIGLPVMICSRPCIDFLSAWAVNSTPHWPVPKALSGCWTLQYKCLLH